MIKVSPLFSGSRGNCTLIQTEQTNILLDAGFPYKSIVAALESRGLSQQDVDAIVITHEHADHIAALPYWTKNYATAVYAPKEIADCIRQRVYLSEVIEIDGSFTVGDVSVDVYECSHDARCCFGYRFCHDGSYFGSVTDTGCATDELIDFLSPCKTVMLESNHDVNMLQKGAYPYPLKQRILSNFGHLSNEQAADVIKRLVGAKAKNIILAHLSENNNTKEIAFNTAVKAVSQLGVTEGKDVNIYVALQYANEITI